MTVCPFKHSVRTSIQVHVQAATFGDFVLCILETASNTIPGGVITEI